MSGTFRLSPVNAGLVLGLLLLAVLLALDLAAMVMIPAPAPAVTENSPFAASDAGVTQGIDAFRSVVQRPLFAPSRRPLPAPSSASTVTAPSGSVPPSFDLVGIVAAGDDHFVLIRPQGARIQRLAPGQTLGDWQLVAIGADRATFANGAARVEIMLARRGAADAMPVSEPWLGQSKPSPAH